jgi:hypothetical protein
MILAPAATANATHPERASPGEISLSKSRSGVWQIPWDTNVGGASPLEVSSEKSPVAELS